LPDEETCAVARKLTLCGIAAVVVFYLMTAPTAAGSAVTHAGTALQHAGHQVAVFLKALG
jgi:hypothetical protein